MKKSLSVEDVVGIVIGTRPDCINDELLNYFAELNKRTFLIIEYGIESANDETLFRINRGHTFECARLQWRNPRLGHHHRWSYHFRTTGRMGESIRQAPVISPLPLDILENSPDANHQRYKTFAKDYEPISMYIQLTNI